MSEFYVLIGQSMADVIMAAASVAVFPVRSMIVKSRFWSRVCIAAVMSVVWLAAGPPRTVAAPESPMQLARTAP